MRVRRAAAAVPSDFHPVLARMFAEVAGSNGKGASEGDKGEKTADSSASVHPTFVCEAENESRLKEGTQRMQRTEFYDFSGDCGQRRSDTYARISDAPSAKDHPSFLRIN